MLNNVTRGFYDKSYLGLWLFQVMGLELDNKSQYVQSLKDEAFPQTADWSLDFWEQAYGLPIDKQMHTEQRRQRLLNKIQEKAPINPERMRLVAKNLTGADAEVLEFVAPYTFKIVLQLSEELTIDYEAFYKYMRRIKPSHLSIETKADFTKYPIEQIVRAIPLVTGINHRYKFMTDILATGIINLACGIIIVRIGSYKRTSITNC